MRRQREQDKTIKYTRLSGKKALEKHAYRQALNDGLRLCETGHQMTILNHKQILSTFCAIMPEVLRNCSQHDKALELLEEAKALLPDERRRFEGAYFES